MGVGEKFADITEKYKNNAEIVLAGYLGVYGTAYLINQNKDILNNSLSMSFLDNSLKIFKFIKNGKLWLFAKLGNKGFGFRARIFRKL